MAEKNDESLLQIGQRFKQFRKERKITQDDLKDIAINIVISRIENGHRMPNGDILVYMANKYDMDINWLLTGQKVSKPVSANTEVLARVGLLETRLKQVEEKLGIKIT